MLAMAYRTTAALLCLLFFLFCDRSVLAEEEELLITLYTAKSSKTGPNPTHVVSVDKPGPARFGSITMYDLKLFDGVGPTAKIMGRGLYVCSKVSSTPDNVWYTTLSILFGPESRLNGSTLQVAGVDPPRDCEWSIVGGTGLLAMARGTVTRKKITDPGSTKNHELTVHAYYTPTNVSIEASVKADPKYSRRQLHGNN